MSSNFYHIKFGYYIRQIQISSPNCLGEHHSCGGPSVGGLHFRITSGVKSRTTYCYVAWYNPGKMDLFSSEVAPGKLSMVRNPKFMDVNHAVNVMSMYSSWSQVVVMKVITTRNLLKLYAWKICDTW